MAGSSRGLVVASMGLAALMGLLAVADFATGVPFGSQVVFDVMFILSAALVIYMGTVKAGEIAAQLMAHGRAADTPVAVVSNGTLAKQSVQIGSLADLAAMDERAPRPALMIIGEVVALRDELRWFSEGLIETAVKAA